MISSSTPGLSARTTCEASALSFEHSTICQTTRSMHGSHRRHGRYSMSAEMLYKNVNISLTWESNMTIRRSWISLGKTCQQRKASSQQQFDHSRRQSAKMCPSYHVHT